HGDEPLLAREVAVEHVEAARGGEQQGRQDVAPRLVGPHEHEHGGDQEQATDRDAVRQIHDLAPKSVHSSFHAQTSDPAPRSDPGSVTSTAPSPSQCRNAASCRRGTTLPTQPTNRSRRTRYGRCCAILIATKPPGTRNASEPTPATRTRPIAPCGRDPGRTPASHMSELSTAQR